MHDPIYSCDLFHRVHSNKKCCLYLESFLWPMNLLSLKMTTWVLLKRQHLSLISVIKIWNRNKNAWFWVGCYKCNHPHFHQGGMLRWQASTLALAAAAKEERLKETYGTALLMKITYQVTAGVRWKTTCLGDAASRPGVINRPARQCHGRESCQCRCKHPWSCACSQQERIRQGGGTIGRNHRAEPTTRPAPITGTHGSAEQNCFYVRCDLFLLWSSR